MMMSTTRRHRGSALLAALIVIGVLALVTVATLRLASISKEQATRDARLLSQTSCAEAARQYVLGRMRVFGIPGAVEQVIATETGDRKVYTGHVDTATIVTIKAASPKAGGGAKRNVRDLTNVIVGTGGGSGQPFGVVVSCIDPLAGPMEVELLIRWGI